MRAIRFRTIPKGDLPHYSYIFRKPEPLGTKMNNMACSRLGTILHLDIQKGKEAMKKLTFQSELGGTAACTRRLAIATKGWGQLTSNDTYFADSWFSSVKNCWGDCGCRSRLLRAGEDKPHGILFSYVRKVDERLAVRVISCFEE